MSSSEPPAAKTCADWAKLSPEEIQLHLATVPAWKLIEEDGISKLELCFRSKTFNSSLEYLSSIGLIADRMDHHPDVHVTSFRNVRIVVYTFSLKGLTELDFNLAKAIDNEIPR